ncbi:vWA domain-containing protein [Serinicoccus kebangsaanensis]|uniref:vWA domain-containing protein n=1 Tax=Serinicoccus kebangsaanensis TaxID=2602069 RepID=UPI00124E2F8C|nr:VWA domain-containing protein [Serinicoccus kebangsaanensis]
MKTTTATTTALALALALASCDGTSGSEESAPSGTQVSDAVEESTDAEEDAAATSAPPAASGIPELVPVEWADAPRELTDVEREFMYAPGPYAGDAYDEDAAYQAVLAMEPQSAQEWQRAIQSQVQGDYAEDVKAAILFDPSLSDRAAEPTEGEAPQAETVGSNHFAIVLDASGSMAAEARSGTRMAEAKAAIAEFADTLPEGSTVSLRIYGHEGDNTDAGKAESCESSEVVFEGDAAGSGLGEALDEVESVGWTPLARAVRDSADDIPEDATDGIVYVVTDGLESCGGDPVQAAQDLAGSGVEPIVNVIGFEVGDADQQALRAMAEAGGGEFTAVGSGADLEEYWAEEYDRMMQAWNEWQQAEMQRISDEGRDNMEEASDVGRRLMEGADAEGDHAMDLASRLGDEDVVDYDTGNDVWRWAYDRKNDMWRWAYDRKNSNWRAAYDEKNLNWRDVYDKGNDKWSEYYRKQVGD